MTHELLLEIGLEELPSRFVESSAKQLEEKVQTFLRDQHLIFEKTQAYSSPRRLAVAVFGLAEKQPDEAIFARGPALKIAKDSDGQWTKAAEGFAKGQGLAVDDLVVDDYKGEDYVFANVFNEGQSAIEVLKGLAEVVEGMTFPINMKWGRSSFQYIRPVHWILALLDDQIIDFEAAGKQTDRYTEGHRFLGEKVAVDQASSYLSVLEDQYVIADRDRRQSMIVDQIEALEQEKGFHVARDQDLLDEVTDLLEYPTAFYGKFSEDYLTLPEEVLIVTMKDHQRYFYVEDDQGTILPYFVSVRNGNADHLETVIAGNEKVIEPRLHDAKFFYEEDQAVSIDDFNDRLHRINFYEGLGTLGDKVDRLVASAKTIAPVLGLTDQETQDFVRAAELSKFDLETGMVDEFSELQGIMGQKYAQLAGENDQVAQALADQYLPTSSQGDLPESRVGAALSIADKLDNLMMFFAAGLEPTGSNDPNALRRQALGILRILLDQSWEVDLKELVEEIASAITFPSQEVEEGFRENQEALADFLKTRVSQILKARQLDADVIEAVMASDQDDFTKLIEAAETLSKHQEDSDYRVVIEQLTRVVNLKDKADEEVTAAVDLAAVDFESPSEEKLFQAVANFEDQKASLEDGEAYYQALSQLAPAIDDFFENNLVFAEDDKVRYNRLALIQRLSEQILDFAAVDRLVIK